MSKKTDGARSLQRLVSLPGEILFRARRALFRPKCHECIYWNGKGDETVGGCRMHMIPSFRHWDCGSGLMKRSPEDLAVREQMRKANNGLSITAIDSDSRHTKTDTAAQDAAQEGER